MRDDAAPERVIAEHVPSVAEDAIAYVEASGSWPKVATEIREAGPFLEAEAADQDYFQRYPESSWFRQPAAAGAETTAA